MSFLAFLPLPAPLAGMPTLTLNDLAEMRVQSISFFLVVLLVAAWGIKLLWNGLRRDFPRLPWLSYRRALALVTLWGFLFVLVLTMISGARELMTPGAWEKNGLTYTLRNNGEHADPQSARWSRIADLKTALWAYADVHDGRLPAGEGELPPAVWESPDLTAAPYLYLGGRRAGEGQDLVAVEPAMFPEPRLTILSDGTIKPIPEAALRPLLTEAEKGDPQ